MSEGCQQTHDNKMLHFFASVINNVGAEARMAPSLEFPEANSCLSRLQLSHPGVVE